MNRIRVFDCLEQYRALQDEVQTAIGRVLQSGQFILGPEVRQFEEEFAAFLGGKGHGVGVNSGTDALAICLMAMGVGRDDEVVTVANTAVPTVSAIRMLGAVPVFCDVDPATCLMDLNELEGRLTPRTRAVIPVHLFGNVVDIHHVRRIIGRRPIRILEDCAQAHGARWRGEPAGTMGDAAAFSFYPTKNLGAYGDGGLCFTHDEALAREMRRIRMYGFDGAYYAEREGVNSRLDELQAAILRVKLKHLPVYIENRRKLAAVYRANLHGLANCVAPGEGVEHAFHLFVVRVPRRDAVRNDLAQREIDTGIHYPHPIHLMRGYAFLGYHAGSLPRTEALAGEVLSLPMYPELAESAVWRVCAELRSILKP